MLARLLLATAALLPFAAFAQDPAAPPAPTTPPAATEAAPVTAPPSRVALHTTMGDIVLELYPDKAPKTVENFLQYVRDGHYNGTIFHRVINGFMLQTGGYTIDLQLKPTRPAIPNEANNGLGNAKGTIAMARAGEPHSATSQFFINVVDNPRLDFVSEQNNFTWGYAVFGKVVDGMEVVEQIRAVETGPQGPLAKDVPKQAIVIERAEILPAPAAATPPATGSEPPAAAAGTPAATP